MFFTFLVFSVNFHQAHTPTFCLSFNTTQQNRIQDVQVEEVKQKTQGLNQSQIEDQQPDRLMYNPSTMVLMMVI